MGSPSTACAHIQSPFGTEPRSRIRLGTSIQKDRFPEGNPFAIAVFCRFVFVPKTGPLLGSRLPFVMWSQNRQNATTRHPQQTGQIFPLLTRFLYSSNSPLKRMMDWLRMVHSSLHTRLMKNWSWETTITPPWNLFSAFASASIVSAHYILFPHSPISRWLVGSSSTRMCGLVFVIMAKDTRVFWPPLSVFTGRSAMSVSQSTESPPPSVTPKRASWLRSCGISSVG